MPRTLSAVAAAVTAAALLGAAPAAGQLSCPDETVKLSVAPVAPVPGQTVAFAYAFCRAEAGGSYTSTVRDLDAAADAPVLHEHTVPLDDVPGVESGADAFTPERAGRYLFSVAYTPAGWTTYRSRGERLVTVVAPAESPAPAPAPGEAVPTPPETPAPQPGDDAAADPSSAPQEPAAATDPVPAGSAPAAGSAPSTAAPATPRRRIRLDARAIPAQVTASRTARLLVTITGASVTPTAAVTVCLKPAAGLRYLSSSRPAPARGERRCARTGHLAAGKRVRIRFTLRAAEGLRPGLLASTLTATSPGAAARTTVRRVRVVADRAP